MPGVILCVVECYVNVVRRVDGTLNVELSRILTKSPKTPESLGKTFDIQGYKHKL